MGANFCHVSRIRPDDRGMPCVTSSFIVRAIVMNIDATGLNSFITVHWPENIKLIITAIISSIEAVDWVKKYLVAASVARGLCFFIMMGMMASMFISNPIQTSSQWELIITMMVPIIIVDRIRMKMIGFISTGRV